MSRVLGDAGVDLSAGDAALRRCDVASDLLFAEPDDGRAFLRAVAVGAYVPGAKRAVYDRCDDGRVETVNVLTRVRGEKRLRVYDAGAWHGTHDQGRRLRIEAVKRWPKSRQMRAASVDWTDLRSFHLALLRPWIDSCSFSVARPSEVNRALARMIASGAITSAKGLPLIGFVSAIELGLETLVVPEARARRRRRRELRGLGLSPDWSGESTEAVDLRPLLVDVDERWLAAAYATVPAGNRGVA